MLGEHVNEAFGTKWGDHTRVLTRKADSRHNLIEHFVELCFGSPVRWKKAKHDTGWFNGQNSLRGTCGDGEGDLEGVAALFLGDWRLAFAEWSGLTSDVVADTHDAKTTIEGSGWALVWARRCDCLEHIGGTWGWADIWEWRAQDDHVDEITRIDESVDRTLFRDAEVECDVIVGDEVGVGRRDDLGILKHAFDEDLVGSKVADRHTSLDLRKVRDGVRWTKATFNFALLNTTGLANIARRCASRNVVRDYEDLDSLYLLANFLFDTLNVVQEGKAR